MSEIAESSTNQQLQLEIEQLCDTVATELFDDDLRNIKQRYIIAQRLYNIREQCYNMSNPRVVVRNKHWAKYRDRINEKRGIKYEADEATNERVGRCRGEFLRYNIDANMYKTFKNLGDDRVLQMIDEHAITSWQGQLRKVKWYIMRHNTPSTDELYDIAVKFIKNDYNEEGASPSDVLAEPLRQHCTDIVQMLKKERPKMPTRKWRSQHEPLYRLRIARQLYELREKCYADPSHDPVSHNVWSAARRYIMSHIPHARFTSMERMNGDATVYEKFAEKSLNDDDIVQFIESSKPFGSATDWKKIEYELVGLVAQQDSLTGSDLLTALKVHYANKNQSNNGNTNENGASTLSTSTSSQSSSSHGGEPSGSSNVNDDHDGFETPQQRKASSAIQRDDGAAASKAAKGARVTPSSDQSTATRELRFPRRAQEKEASEQPQQSDEEEEEDQQSIASDKENSQPSRKRIASTSSSRKSTGSRKKQDPKKYHPESAGSIPSEEADDEEVDPFPTLLQWHNCITGTPNEKKPTRDVPTSASAIRKYLETATRYEMFIGVLSYMEIKAIVGSKRKHEQVDEILEAFASDIQQAVLKASRK
jgi:hypothetical protein